MMGKGVMEERVRTERRVEGRWRRAQERWRVMVMKKGGGGLGDGPRAGAWWRLLLAREMSDGRRWRGGSGAREEGEAWVEREMRGIPRGFFAWVRGIRPGSFLNREG